MASPESFPPDDQGMVRIDNMSTRGKPMCLFEGCELVLKTLGRIQVEENMVRSF